MCNNKYQPMAIIPNLLKGSIIDRQTLYQFNSQNIIIKSIYYKNLLQKYKFYAYKIIYKHLFTFNLYTFLDALINNYTKPLHF